ncbi:MAG: hypothetical protein ABSE63_16485 [Thermoguttaceae bacterium]|jgi:hypothetical protein
MKKSHIQHRSWRILAAALIAMSACQWAAAQPAAAGELDKLETSLKLIPADAAFYSSMLRNREQVEAFLHSNAWEKIKSMPSVQMGLAMYNAQAQQEGSRVWQFQDKIQNPEAKKLINLAADMGSNEIFFYGGKNCNQFVELMQYVVSSMRYGPAILQATGKSQGLSGDKLNAKVILNTLIVHRDLMEFPNVLVGFRLKKPSAANEALIKMEMFLNVAMEAVPKLKGHLNRETIGDDEFLVLRVDGKMIPWEKIPRDEFKRLVDNEADLDKLIEHVKKMEFVFAMGVRDKDLLISLGSSLDCIKNLGSKERLIDLPEFKPLEKFADKRLTHIGYVSKDFLEHVNNNTKTIDDLRDFLDQMIPLAHFTEAQNSQLTKDVGSLAVDLKNMMPKLGSMMDFDFMTDNGYESYQYNWGTHPNMDGSKPLGLLSHVDGNPILGIVGRRKVSIEHYDNIVKWGKAGWNYMEELALPRLPEEQRAKAQAFLADLKPLLARLDTATRDMWLPAVADGQIGLVVDAKLTSKQIQRSMPMLQQEMPILEPALVLGVSNAELLKKAIGEFRGVYNDLIDLIVKQNDVPQEAKANLVMFKWPEAKVDQIAGGSLYSYALPDQWGVDKKIVPNAGLTNNVAVISLSTAQTDRLLKETPLTVGGVLANTDRPLAVAGWFDWKALVGAATPWVNYVMEQAPAGGMGGQKELVIGQVHTVLEVLSTIKGITSETYMEGNIIVSHSLVEIQDLGK